MDGDGKGKMCPFLARTTRAENAAARAPKPSTEMRHVKMDGSSLLPSSFSPAWKHHLVFRNWDHGLGLFRTRLHFLGYLLWEHRIQGICVQTVHVELRASVLRVAERRGHAHE